MKLPRFIAIVGNPKSGKSAIAEILVWHFGAKLIDSGMPMRVMAMMHYGLKPWHVFTQDGKAQHIKILDEDWEVRRLLGELGNRLEEMHGDWINPWMVTHTIPADDPGPFVDPACRKNQGAYYKTLGGIVIGVERPGCGPSGYEFDRVREEHVDRWVQNNGTLEDLSSSVIDIFNPYAANKIE